MTRVTLIGLGEVGTVFAEDLADYVELLLRRYEHRKNGHASFSDYVHSLDKDQLALFAEPPAEMTQR